MTENAETESTTDASQPTSEREGPKYYLVVNQVVEGQPKIEVIEAETKKEIIAAVGSYADEHIVGVFKGRKLQLRKFVSYDF